MAREARVVVEMHDDMDAMLVKRALERQGGRFDVERRGTMIDCYVDAPADPSETARALQAFLTDGGFADRVVDRLKTEWWEDSTYRYVDRDNVPRHVFEPLTDVTWRVTVEPTGVFDWRAARREILAARPPLKESRKAVEIPAQDEADALRIAGALRTVSGLGSLRVEKLGVFQRWRARQRVFGSYESGGG